MIWFTEVISVMEVKTKTWLTCYNMNSAFDQDIQKNKIKQRQVV